MCHVTQRRHSFDFGVIFHRMPIDFVHGAETASCKEHSKLQLALLQPFEWCELSKSLREYTCQQPV